LAFGFQVDEIAAMLLAGECTTARSAAVVSVTHVVEYDLHAGMQRTWNNESMVAMKAMRTSYTSSMPWCEARHRRLLQRHVHKTLKSLAPFALHSANIKFVVSYIRRKIVSSWSLDTENV